MSLSISMSISCNTLSKDDTLFVFFSIQDGAQRNQQPSTCLIKNLSHSSEASASLGEDDRSILYTKLSIRSKINKVKEIENTENGMDGR